MSGLKQRTKEEKQHLCCKACEGEVIAPEGVVSFPGRRACFVPPLPEV